MHILGSAALFALVALLPPRVAEADKYDDAFTRSQKAFDAWKEVADRYAGLRAKYDRYYAPITPQWQVVVTARKNADDACAKNKRTKACRDLTLAYAAEHKKYNALVWDKDNADPKHEFDAASLHVLHAEQTKRATEYDTIYKATKKLLEDAAFKATSKAERDQIDAKLAKQEKKRGERFAAGRGAEAQSRMPQSNSSSSSSSGSSHSVNSSVMDSARRTGDALGKQ